jgi:uncharacterized repeat protein (TIGR01451 family)
MHFLSRAVSVLFFTALVTNAQAADRTWTGAGGNSNFTNTGNWVGGLIPGAGDRAIFPVGPANKVVSFTVPLTLQAVVMQDCGYQLGQLTTSSLTLTAATPVDVRCDINGGTNIIGGNPVTVPNNATILHRTDGGAAVSNTTLQLGVTNGVDFDGQIVFDTSQLTTGRVPRIQTRLIERTAGAVQKIGTGTLIFGSANTYTGLTRVQSGVLEIGDNGALGSTSNGTIVTGPGVLNLNAPSLDVDGETLSLANDAILDIPVVVAANNARWGGPINLGGTAPIANRRADVELRNTTLNVAGAISGPANLRIVGTTGTGSLNLQAAASYTGSTEIFSNARLLVNSLSNVLPNTTAILLNGGEFNYSTSGPNVVDEIESIRGNGTVNLAVNTTIRLLGNSSYSWDGFVTGGGNVIKFGTGVLTLGALSASTGSFSVREGKVIVTNSGNTMPMIVEQAGVLGSDVAASTGALTGGSAFAAEIQPGDSGFGVITVEGNFSTGTQALTVFDLIGNNPGVNQDWITVPNALDTVTLSGPLAVNLPTPLPFGTSAMLINNSGADAIIGTFNALPEGAVQNFSGNFYRVSYVGGDGNDFAITRPAALSFITPSPLPNGSVGVPYGGSIVATGGFPPYTFSAISGLPPGVTLNSSGAFVGTPTGSGVFNFNVDVQDSTAAVASQNYQLTINPPVFTWDGGGVDNNWTTPQNWAPDVAPVAGIDARLVFPSAAARKSNNNDFPALSAFARLEVEEGYTIGGASIRLTAPTTVVQFRNTNNGTLVSRINNALEFVTATPTIDFLTQQSSGTFTAIVGTPSQSISFNGTLTLLAGRDSAAVNGQLWVENLNETSAGANVVVRSTGTFPTTLDCRGPNNYSGTTVFEAGTVNILRSATCLGAGDGTTGTGTTVLDATLIASPATSMTFSNERLQLNDTPASGVARLGHSGGAGSSTTWGGPVVLATATGNPQLAVQGSGDLNITGAISGTANKVVIDTQSTGRVQFGNPSNNYSAITDVGFPGSNSVLRLLAGEVIPDTSTVSVPTNGTLIINDNIETVAGLTGVGAVDLSGSLSNFRVNTASPFSFGGTLSGTLPGRLSKQGPSSLTMTAARVFAGSEVVEAGDYTIAASTTAAIRVGNGNLRGTGSIGALNNDLPGSTGTIRPDPGTAFNTQNIQLSSPLALLSVSASGLLGRLNATGTVSLSGALLNLETNQAFPLSSELVLISNDAVDPVTGIFSGLGNNSYVSSAGSNPQSFRIRYAGGDGNDVTVVRETPVQIVTTTLPAGSVGVAYSQNLSASDGELDYVFDVASGSLPPGLSISNLMSFATLDGTPTAPGTYNFDLRVTDNNGNTDIEPLTVVINSSDFIWDGGGADNLWSNAQNWVGDVAPTPGLNQRLVFPPAAARPSNVNDFTAGASFSQLRIEGPGYSISGNDLVLGGADGLYLVATPTPGPDSEIELGMLLSSDEVQVDTAGNGPRHGFRINTAPSTRAVQINSISFLTNLINVDAGTAVPSVVIGRLRFGGGYSGNVQIDGNPGIVDLVDSSHAGTLVLQRGVLRVSNALGLGTGDGLASSGTEIQSGALMLLAPGVITPPLERIFLHNNQGAVPSLEYGNGARTDGEISIGGNVELRIGGGAPAFATVRGPITGTGGIDVGTLLPNGILALENASNSWSGPLTVGAQATLATVGSERIPDGSNVQIFPDGRLHLTASSVETVADVISSGIVQPGTARLLTGDATFDNASTFRVELSGTAPGTNQSQLAATGTVTITAPTTLDVSTSGLLYGSIMTIIDNDLSDPVSGTFQGLAENANVALGGSNFQIRYGAGDGNDVVLYRIDPLAVSAPVSLVSGTINVPYSQATSATGGQTPYTFSATGLPAGLSINSGSGLISGTPMAAGSFSVDVMVTDGFATPANTVTRNYTLLIANAEATSTTISGVTPASPQSFSTGATFTPTVVVTGTSARPSGSVLLTATRQEAPSTAVNCSIPTLANGAGPFDSIGSCALTPSTPGIWRVQAQFTGSGGFLDSTSTTIDHTMRGTTSFGVITQSLNPTVVGQPFDVVINMSGQNLPPPGDVSVLPLPVGNAGTCTLVATGANTSACTVTIISPAAVSKILSIGYQGSGGAVPAFLPQSAPQQTHVTNKAESLVSITAAGPDPAIQNQPITVNFRVAIRAPGTPTSIAPIDGMVRVSDGVANCNGGVTQVGNVANGSCSLSLSTLGLRALTAEFLGNAAFMGSVSQVEAQNVVAAGSPPDLAVLIDNGLRMLQPGQSVTYTVRVLNFGPAAVNGASVNVPLPLGASSMSWTCAPVGGSTCGAPSGTGAIVQTVNLAPPGAEPSEVRFTITLNAPNQEGAFQAAATVQPPGGNDFNNSNNSALDRDFIGVFGDGFE